MSGQFGFTATDPVPSQHWEYEFSAEDIEELGLPLCINIADRVRLREGPIVLSEKAALRLRELGVSPEPDA